MRNPLSEQSFLFICHALPLILGLANVVGQPYAVSDYHTIFIRSLG
jgi:hypothetical protein